MPLILLALLLLAAPAWAQTPAVAPVPGLIPSAAVPNVYQPPITSATSSSVTASPDVTATGTIGALNAAVTVVLSGRQSVGVELANAVPGTTITMTPEILVGTVWTSAFFFNSATGLVSQTLVLSDVANQVAQIFPVAGAAQVRVRASTYIAGLGTASLVASASSLWVPPVTYANNGVSGVLLGTPIMGQGVDNNAYILRATTAHAAASDFGLVVRQAEAVEAIGATHDGYAYIVGGLDPAMLVRPLNVTTGGVLNVAPPQTLYVKCNPLRRTFCQ